MMPMTVTHSDLQRNSAGARSTVVGNSFAAYRPLLRRRGARGDFAEAVASRVG
jgi:hypothetical protein